MEKAKVDYEHGIFELIVLHHKSAGMVEYLLESEASFYMTE
jgi:hypothetical protein